MNIIIYGNGDFAKLMQYYFDTDSNYRTVVFCVDKEYIQEPIINNLPVVAFEDIENKYSNTEYKMFVAIGYSHMRVRKIIYKKAKNKGYELVNYISSKVTKDDSNIIGENNAILHNVVLEPFAKIGNNNILWSSSVICHNVVIKDHSFIASQSLVGGYSIVNDNCFLGFNSTIIHNIEVAEETLVGAKSLILKDTDKKSKYIGSVAKKVSEHHEGIEIS